MCSLTHDHVKQQNQHNCFNKGRFGMFVMQRGKDHNRLMCVSVSDMCLTSCSMYYTTYLLPLTTLALPLRLCVCVCVCFHGHQSV